uniref:Uncharacterized protein n=1 Tax=Arundo donax TaxID=35708 RepID=A0A0A9FL72_ARUDO
MCLFSLHPACVYSKLFIQTESCFPFVLL